MRGFDKLLLPIGLLCLVVFGRVWKANAMVEPIALPQDLLEHLDLCKSMGNLTQQTGQGLFWSAMQHYMSKFVGQRPSMSQQEVSFYRNTIQNSMNSLRPTNGRGKRQAAQPRIRKEIRSMTVEERTRYFNAVNSMKNDRRLAPNVYDVLSTMHSGANIGRAHFGPSFPGWHRLYLFLYESFLQLHDPTVTVPFWASVLDQEMADPTQSVIFSDSFFGPGVGLPTSGPFRAWGQINPATEFRRNAGSGTLYTYNGVEQILLRTRNRQILIPTADPDANLEIQHGGPHTFIGGNMNALQTAAEDPIFYSHHAFVDQIWERFRWRQRELGIDTENDYPFDASDPRFRPSHNPTAITGFFPNGEMNIDFTHILGHSNIFFNLVRYEAVPACPTCNNSPYLFCNQMLRPPRCVSRTIAEVRLNDPSLVDNLPGVSIFGNSMTGARRRSIRAVHDMYGDDVCPKRTFINDIDVNEIRQIGGSPFAPRNPGNWAYVPARIVSRRPSRYKGFGRYSLDRPSNQFNFESSKDGLYRQEIQKEYENCERSQDDSVNKIKIVTYGLNYEGYSEEYAVVDNRLGVDQAISYIPVRMPDRSGPSEAIVAAFDSCGRVCTPFSTSNSEGGTMPNGIYSGGVRVSANAPRQFGVSYSDAMYNIWTPHPGSAPYIDYNQVPISFFCDYSNSWIWESHLGPHFHTGGNFITQGGSAVVPNNGGVQMENMSGGGNNWRDMNQGQGQWRRRSKRGHSARRVIPGTIVTRRVRGGAAFYK